MKCGTMSAPKDDEQDRSSKEWQVDPPKNSEQNCDRALRIARTDGPTNQTGHFSPTVNAVAPPGQEDHPSFLVGGADKG